MSKNLKKLPGYCNGCGRRVDSYMCRGWTDPSGCRGEHWASAEQVKNEEQERREHVEWRHSLIKGICQKI